MIRLFPAKPFLAFLVCLAAPLAALPAAAQDGTSAHPKKPPAAQAKTAQAKTAQAKPAAAKPAQKTEPAQKGPAGQALLLATAGDWGAYVSQQGKTKVCYALTQPKTRLPQGLNRDPAYLFVSTRPSENVRNEVSVVMGFATKDEIESQAVVGNETFALITKGGSAWVKNPAEEGRVLAAFKGGAKVVVKAESKRGNKLSDEYSLKGFNQALERAASECAK